MLLFIWLYPVLGFCMSVICFDLARNFKQKNRISWVFLAFLSAMFFAGIVSWFMFRGDLNAQKWAKEWSQR